MLLATPKADKYSAFVVGVADRALAKVTCSTQVDPP